MYYYIDIIKRREKFGIIWMAAFDFADFRNRKITSIIRAYDIERSCDDILRYSAEGRDNCPRMNLYVTSTLLCGVCKVFRRMSVIALGDAANIYAKWGEKCRLMSIRDIKRCYRRPLGFGAIEEFGEDLMRHKQNRKRKASLKTHDVGKEETIRPLEEEELVEMLREVDTSAMPHLVDPKSITIQELPEQLPAAAELTEQQKDKNPGTAIFFIHQSFGGEGLESLLPEVRDVLLGIEPSIDADVPTEIPVPEEIVPQAAPEVTSQVPPEVVPVVVPEELPMVVPEELPLMVPEELPVVAPEELPVVAPEELPVVVPEDLPELIQAQGEVQVEVRVPTPAEVAPRIREQGHQIRRKDAVITMNRRRPVQRIDFMETLIHREEKWARPEDVEICEALLPAAELIMNVPGAKNPKKNVINFRSLYSQLQQDYELYGEMQQIRAGLETSSIRPSIGSPTPTMESRITQGKPSPSQVQSDGKISFPEMNLLPLETITEMLPAEDLQLPTELSMVVEDPMKGGEEVEELAVNEKEEPPKKRLRTDKERSPAERSRVEQEETPAKRLKVEDEPSLSPSVSSSGRNERKFMSLFERLEEKNEMIKFSDLAPPKSTTKLEAARLFTALLCLEKNRVLKTQQLECYGDIYIYRQQENLSSP